MPSSRNEETPTELPAMRLVRHSTRVARLVARLLLLALLLAALGLLLAPWQQNVTGQGRVIAYAPLERQQSIQAPIAGRITHWAVQEGSRVKEGDLIVELSDNDADLMARLQEQRNAIEARLSAAQSQRMAYESRVEALRSSRAASIEAAGSRVRMVQERIRSAEQSLAAAEAARETARLNLERQRTLHKDGLTATRSVELAQLELTKATTDAESARASLSAARNELGALGSDRQRIQTDADAHINDGLAKYEYAKAELAKERIELAKLESTMARQSTQQVRAPRAGTILRQVARQGAEVVKAGDTLAVLVPDTQSSAVELYVHGNDAPLISPGRHVRLQFEGWPAVQFAGWPSVAVGTFGGTVAFVDAADDGRGRFRIVVVPDKDEEWPSGRFLRQGVRANGWILLDKVRLGYEMWRQFNGFPPALSSSEASLAGTEKSGHKSEDKDDDKDDGSGGKS
ncbi:HlyD family efflux transporter periplasmic adaptor subunit [Archangium violaceum]|uniref:HlyD family secretion protein n=1 Tax=Archangium violaceum TaxID=83451 RepID=UPI00193B3BD8|nr:HlyD family efflux transporter periplasmic adaptor subunit [Archangium violaceum]QRK06300.1 HlyD family efflux transporter periplasmic adaptor subunit [Archangium violaceum]